QSHHGGVYIIPHKAFIQNAFYLLCKHGTNGSTFKTVFVLLQLGRVACAERSRSIFSYQIGQNVLISTQQETTCSTSRVGNALPQLRSHQFSHQFNDVSWCAELSVLTCRGNF